MACKPEIRFVRALLRQLKNRASRAASRLRYPVRHSDVVTVFAGLGPVRSTALVVHSSLSACGHVSGGAQTILRALRDWAGPATIVMPTHTYCYPAADGSVPVFHPAQTPSVVGSLTNVFLRQKDVIRSVHPTHSVAAQGPDATQICIGHESCDTPCGHGTPYQKLIQSDCAALMFGVSLKVYTLFYTSEDEAGVSHLYEKAPYRLKYDMGDGVVREMLMRRQDMSIPRRFVEMGAWLECRGLLQRVKLGRGELLYVPSCLAVHRVVVAALAQDPLFLRRVR